MENAINLFAISRVENYTTFLPFEKQLSNKTQQSGAQIHELVSLRIFVDKILSEGVQIHQLDGYFFSYKIPQIGKEFDLLKISKEECLNIELKSEPVAEEKIEVQLRKNKHYLSHLMKRTQLFTYETQTGKCYCLDNNGELSVCAISDIVTAICQFPADYFPQIAPLFKPADYLVSPLNTPEKFLNDEYFLTQQQEEIVKKIIKKMEEPGGKFVSVEGGPGTGKTLLLYHLAKKLSVIGKVLIIHCGVLSEGHLKIGECLSLVNVVAAKMVKSDFDLSKYSFILVDESHRAYEKLFEIVTQNALAWGQLCVFSSDSGQTLSEAEIKRNIVSKINTLMPLSQFTLSNKIRTNKEMASFIVSLSDLNRKRIGDYTNVDILYAKNPTEAGELLTLYKSNGYTFINFSKSNYCISPYLAYRLWEDSDTHKVIGQEFDRVIMILDNSFFYNEKGKLSAVQHPNPDYLYIRLLYQGVTRVREKLALIVVDNAPLLDKLLTIF